jgi:hypothetical protein
MDESTYAEPVTPSIQPELHHSIHGLPHLGVIPIKIGLLWEVNVKVIFICVSIVFPS